MTIIGTDSDDSLFGTIKDEKIKGEAGNDTIEGGNGHDYIDDAFGGNDFLNGGAGSGTILGGAGNDMIKGEAGDDNIDAGDGDDGVWSGIGNDTIFGSGIEVKEQAYKFGAAADGHAWVELDSYGNSSMAQNIDTESGATSQLSIDDTARPYVSPSEIEVYWDVKLVDILSGYGRHCNNWKTYTYEVQGGKLDTTQLEFRAIDPSNGVGGFIDNIQVRQFDDSAADKLGTKAVAGNDKIYAGQGNDLVIGGAGWDSIYGGSGNDKYLV